MLTQRMDQMFQHHWPEMLVKRNKNKSLNFNNKSKIMMIIMMKVGMLVEGDQANPQIQPKSNLHQHKNNIKFKKRKFII